MKIALVTPEIVPANGGISTYSVNVACQLSRKHEIVLISPGESGSIQKGFARILGHFPERLRVFSTTESDIHDPAMRTLMHQIGLFRTIKMVRDDERPDIFHFAAPHGSGLGGLIAGQTPNIVTVHSSIAQDVSGISNTPHSTTLMRRTDVLKVLLARFLSKHESVILNRADAIVAVSRTMMPEISRRFPRVPLHHIENGVDTDLFTPDEADCTADAKSAKILVVSRLTPAKGIAVALESCRLLANEGYRNLEFAFAGSGNKRGYEALARRLGVGDNCTFLGDVDYAGMPDLYRNADIFCCPSLQENFPMSVLEAMATGLPCVATSVGSVPEIIENEINGLIVEPGNPYQLARAIRMLIDEPQAMERFGHAARLRAVERFSASRMCRHLMNLYAEHIGA